MFPKSPLKKRQHLVTCCPCKTSEMLRDTQHVKKLSVSYRCVLTDPPWSIQGPQVEHREPLKCLIQGEGRMEEAEEEGETQRKMLSLASIPSSVLLCWWEGSHWKQMTYIFFETDCSSKASPDSEKTEWSMERRRRKWEEGVWGEGIEKRSTGRLPVWQGRHETVASQADKRKAGKFWR